MSRKCLDAVCNNLARRQGKYCNSCAQLHSRYHVKSIAAKTSLIQDQNGLCFFCGKESSLFIFCDNTKQIQGMICGSCKSLLGILRKNVHKPYFERMLGYAVS